MKILIVDDDDNSRVFLERALRAQRHEVESASNGVSALQKARSRHPDVIVSDILMPEMNGFELCRRIKTDEGLRHIPFIFYTATFVDQKDERLAMALGASRFLVKPMEPAEFLRAVEEVIGEYEARKLPVPDSPLEEMRELCRKQAEALQRKLDKKIRELEKERTALRESEARFRALTESTSDWIWEIDRNGVYTYSSPKSKELLGYEPAEVVGKTPFDFMPADEAARMAQEFKSVATSGKPFATLENVNLHKDGRMVVLETSGVPFFDSEGQLKGYRGIDRDITERKKLQEQLSHAQKMESVGQFAGGIAHDFTNMLTAIMGYGEILRTDLAKDSPSQHYVEQILSAAAKSANLTRQLLAFSRKQIISPKYTDINELIRGVEKLLRRLIGEDVDIRLTLAAGGLTVFVDPGQMEQVLMNLCTNARDAMPNGGSLFIGTGTAYLDPKYVLSHDVEKAGEYALLTVTDTGIGMDEETRQRIFEPFFTTKEVDKGTGLGLAVVYGIIKQHDGHVTVYSEPGRGTTFKIYLPLSACPAENEAGRRVIAPERGTETILVAEDNEDVRNLMKQVLQKNGYKVIEAPDGEDAVTTFSAHRERIQLVVMDVIMPKKSGKEVCEEIRRIRPDIKVLFVSGYTADIIHRKGILEEEVDFISKPLSTRDLLVKVRETLDR